MKGTRLEIVISCEDGFRKLLVFLCLKSSCVLDLVLDSSQSGLKWTSMSFHISAEESFALYAQAPGYEYTTHFLAVFCPVHLCFITDEC